MSRVDLNANRSELNNAFKEVTDPKSSNDWVLYSYEGKTNVLKVAAKGDGGIEELIDDLSSGKIMYAFCRVTDPNTGLPKLVLINWQGEGVPEIRKGSCANHISDVTKMFRGAHVTINARNEDDVDEEDIMKKVAKSSGSNYSFHKEKPQPNANKPSGPVGSVYKKTRPHIEINTSVRDQFWQKQQNEEKERQAMSRQKSVDEKTKQERETKEREAKEASDREARERERMQKVVQMKQAEKRADAKNTEAEKAAWEKTQQDSQRDELERQKRADQLRKDRAMEAQSLVQNRQNNPRTMFDQKPASQFDQPGQSAQPPPARKLKHGFMEERQESTERKRPIELPREDPASPTSPPPRAASPPRPPPAREAPPPAREAPPPAREAPPPARQEPPPARQEPPPAAPPAGPPHTRNLLAEGLPPRQNSDDEEEDQDWDEPSAEDFSPPVTTPAPPQPEPEDLYDDVSAATPQQPDDIYDDVSSPAAPSDIYDDVSAPGGAAPPQELYDEMERMGGGPETFSADQGVVARALYDYQAMEDNEITFDPGDLITNVDQVDPGWWVGTAPDGCQGMFPSNYVELING